MRRILGFAACAIVLATAVTAGNQVAVLDGTTWALTVVPDSMAKDSGVTGFKETLTFVDGKASLSVPQVGVQEAPYSVSKFGDTGWTFQTKRASAADGSSIWTGTVHGDSIEGKLVLTHGSGVVQTYTFKGFKLS